MRSIFWFCETSSNWDYRKPGYSIVRHCLVEEKQKRTLCNFCATSSAWHQVPSPLKHNKNQTLLNTMFQI